LITPFTDDKFGNLFIGGNSWINEGEGPTTRWQTVALLYKLDPNGDDLWGASYDSEYGFDYADEILSAFLDGDDSFTDAIVDDLGNVFVVGNYTGGVEDGENDDDDDNEDDDSGCGC